MIIDTTMSKEDINEKLLDTRKLTTSDHVIILGVQPTTSTLSLLAYKNLSPQGATIWQQLPVRDKQFLISTTSKQRRLNEKKKMTRNKKNANSKQHATNVNQLNWNKHSPKYTRKCCRQRGTPTGKLFKFRTIVDHQEMNVNNRHYSGSFYDLIILWENEQVADVPLYK